MRPRNTRLKELKQKIDHIQSARKEENDRITQVQLITITGSKIDAVYDNKTQMLYLWGVSVEQCAELGMDIKPVVNKE